MSQVDVIAIDGPVASGKEAFLPALPRLWIFMCWTAARSIV